MATFASFSTLLRDRVRAVDPAWRWAIGAYAVARLAYTLWSLVILALVPTVVQNLNLFGVPVVAVFNLNTGERYVYARQVNGRALSFRKGAGNTVIDDETGSTWALDDGNATQGPLVGDTLGRGTVTAEEVFPYHGVPAQGGWFGVWQRFDAVWYQAIAENGYAWDSASTVYFPLYPLLIRMATPLMGGNDLLAAIVISNIALVGALYFVFRLAEMSGSQETAKRTVVYLVVFPTAFFFLAPYTEALFLALAAAALYAGYRQRWIWAGVFGAAAALTRLQGVLLVVPLLYLAWTQVEGGRRILSRARVRAILPLGLILIVSGAFLAYNRLSLLASYQGELHAQFVLPWNNVRAAVELIVQGRAVPVDVLNLLLTLLFGAMCVVVFFKLPRGLALYTLVMFLAPLFRQTTTQPLVSMARYVLVLFPVFMVWGLWGKNPWLNRLIVYPCVLLSLYCSAQYFLWGWVA